MNVPEFWSCLAARVTGVLQSSPDNHIRFLAIDAFDIGTGNVTVSLEARTVMLRAWVFGGRISIYAVKLHLSDLAAELWSKGDWRALLPAAEATDWLSIDVEAGSVEIQLSG
ncbi:MAG TPA: hypothetical protein VG742_05345 [Dongiaceae bacterium]|nr:hypothetical protein [Dongiaceae bacterium]